MFVKLKVEFRFMSGQSISQHPLRVDTKERILPEPTEDTSRNLPRLAAGNFLTLSSVHKRCLRYSKGFLLSSPTGTHGIHRRSQMAYRVKSQQRPNSQHQLTDNTVSNYANLYSKKCDRGKSVCVNKLIRVEQLSYILIKELTMSSD